MPKKIKVIRYRCDNCGASLESVSSFAGKNEDCPICNNLLYVPIKSTQGALFFINLISRKALLYILSFVILVLVLLLWTFLRDTWEQDHKYELVQMGQEIISFFDAGIRAEGFSKYDNFKSIIGGREVRDPEILKLINAIEVSVKLAKAQIVEEQRMRKLLEQEPQVIASLFEMENGAELAQKTNPKLAADIYKNILDAIRVNDTGSMAFKQVYSRVNTAQKKVAAPLAKFEEYVKGEVKALLRDGAFLSMLRDSFSDPYPSYGLVCKYCVSRRFEIRIILDSYEFHLYNEQRLIPFCYPRKELYESILTRLRDSQYWSYAESYVEVFDLRIVER